jgi:arginase family enzyme
MKTSVIVCPFALFGSPGTQQGAELLADAMREMLEDVRAEKRPTRGRAYLRHVRIEELDFGTLKDVAAWRERAAEAARRALKAGDFLVWLGGNHLSGLPVYEELAAIGDSLVVQFDAHLDLYNLSGVTETLSHGNFLRHAERLPEIVNVGHRDLFLPAKAIREYYIETFAASDLAVDAGPVVHALHEATEDAGRVFIDIDCDVFDPAYFPGLADPLPFGLSPDLVLRLMEAVWSDRVCGVALSEFDPGRDRDDRSLSTLVWLLEYMLLRRYE